MESIREKLKGYKTYILAAVGIISAIAGFLTGDLTLAQAGELILGALISMSIRAGIATESSKSAQDPK